MPDDPVREANVKSFDRLVPVFQRVLKVDRTRISMSTKLGTLGIDDSTAIKLQSALEKEFGVEIPARLLLPNGFVNDLVTYISLHVYKVDTSGTQHERSGPVSPDFLKGEEQEKKRQSGNDNASQSTSAAETPVNPTVNSTASPASTPIPNAASDPASNPSRSASTKAK